MSTRWILVGSDAPLLAALADQAPANTDCVAGGTDIDALVRAAMTAGEQWFAVAGGDAELHAAVDAMRACIDEGWTGSPLSVRFPADPSIDLQEPICLVVALLPTAPGGLAQTLGIDPHPASSLPMLATDRAWGPLDVGRVIVDERETVLVSAFDVGIDAMGRKAQRTFDCTMHGRLAKRRHDPVEAHERNDVSLGWIAIGNGQYEGSARIAPRAVPHDRALDVLVASGDARTVARWRRSARRSAHVPDPAIEEWLCDRVSLRFDEPVPARLDGIPITFRHFDVRLSRLGIALKI